MPYLGGSTNTPDELCKIVNYNYKKNMELDQLISVPVFRIANVMTEDLMNSRLNVNGIPFRRLKWYAGSQSSSHGVTVSINEQINHCHNMMST